MSVLCRALPLGALFLLVSIVPAQAQSASAPSTSARPAPDGQRDFDFEIGDWRTHLRYRAPLDSTATWAEYTGTSIVSKLMGGGANVVELDVSGPAGRIAGLSLRLYDPPGRQWSLNFASARSGKLTAPVVGAFTDGRGEFIGLDEHEGSVVLVRFVIEPITPDSVRFEQAYSADHGRHWITNWIATDTRIRRGATP